jgi:hypothetical protein
MMGVHQHPSIYLLRWGLVNFLPGVAWKHDLPDLCLSSSWDYRCEPLVPS